MVFEKSVGCQLPKTSVALTNSRWIASITGNECRFAPMQKSRKMKSNPTQSIPATEARARMHRG